MARNIHCDDEFPPDLVIDTGFDPTPIKRQTSYLTEDVTQSDLTKLNEMNLTARLAYYERLYAFERNARVQIECRNEVERTRIEINRRRMYLTSEAERVFEL